MPAQTLFPDTFIKTISFYGNLGKLTKKQSTKFELPSSIIGKSEYPINFVSVEDVAEFTSIY
jgi:hypothetical protein